MTVGELKKKLQEFDDSLPVIMEIFVPEGCPINYSCDKAFLDVMARTMSGEVKMLVLTHHRSVEQEFDEMIDEIDRAIFGNKWAFLKEKENE